MASPSEGLDNIVTLGPPMDANRRTATTSIPEAPMPDVIKTAELATGVRLPYVEQGEPGGVPMVLLHGFTDSWRSFEPVLPHLPERLRVFALTQRGHGDAERPATGYRTRDFAADLLAFCDALELRPAVLVGHSAGCATALRFAIDHPDRTLGIVLIGAPATYRDNPAVVEFYESAVSGLTDPIDPGFVREFQASTLAQPVPPQFLDTVVQESLKVPAHVWRETLAGCLQDDFAAELGRVRAPTLLVWGAQDGFCARSEQEALLAAIPGSRLLVHESAGHGVHWEEPERFAAELAAFADDLEEDARGGMTRGDRSTV